MFYIGKTVPFRQCKCYDWFISMKETWQDIRDYQSLEILILSYICIYIYVCIKESEFISIRVTRLYTLETMHSKTELMNTVNFKKIGLAKKKKRRGCLLRIFIV